MESITIFMDKGSRQEQADAISINNIHYQESFIDEIIPGSQCFLAVICDGMGTHSRHLISRFVCEHISRSLQLLPELSKQHFPTIIETTHHECNKLFSDCGSTLALACKTLSNTLLLASIGDSIIYGIHDKTIKRISNPQALHGFLQAGIGPKFQATFSKNQIQIFDLDLSFFDTILLCTDGVANSQMGIMLSENFSWNFSNFMDHARSTLYRDNASFLLLPT